MREPEVDQVPENLSILFTVNFIGENMRTNGCPDTVRVGIER